MKRVQHAACFRSGADPVTNAQGYLLQVTPAGIVIAGADRAGTFYGVQTLRGAENFPITGLPLNPALIRAMGRVKKAAALANRDTGHLDACIRRYGKRRRRTAYRPNIELNVQRVTQDVDD